MEKEEMKKRIRSGYVDMYESQTIDEDIQKGFQLIEKEESVIGKIMEEMVSDGDEVRQTVKSVSGIYAERTRSSGLRPDRTLRLVFAYHY